MKTTKLLSIIALLALSSTVSAYPDRPVKLVVGYAPGGTTDNVARVLSQCMAEKLDRPVVVENRPGANGILATDFVKKSAPDGYTIILSASGHAINPSIYKGAKYDPVGDFTAIGMVLTSPNVLVVSAKSTLTTIKAIQERDRTNPNSLNIASSGIGSSLHLSAELFAQQTGIKFTHIPYKGTGAAIGDLLSGTVDMMFPNLTTVLPMINDGRLIAVGVTSRDRSPTAPNIPTLEQVGVPNYDLNTWYGMLGPADLPKSVVTKLNTTLNSCLGNSAVLEQLKAKGVDTKTSTPEEFNDFISKETVKWDHLVKSLRLRLD